MFVRGLLVATFVTSLAGCASTGGPGAGTIPGSPPGAFAHRVATSEVVLFWNCLQPEVGQLRLEGVAQNPWAAQPIRFLEFELVGLDAQGRMTAETAGMARDLQLHTNQTTPFKLDLKTTGTEVRFDLYYRYYFLEFFEGGKKDLRLAGPPMAGPRLLAQTNTFVARDVCADTQHRAR
jgi:hypothetical protein